MMITVKYFGAIADATQKKEEQWQVATDAIGLEALRSQFEIKYPDIINIGYVIAVNQLVVTKNFILINENDELALLPPFAGG